MNSFWERSWKNIDSERIVEYINHFDLVPDVIVDFLLSRQVITVCDAGCGCGIYSLKLASNGFTVSGFDISSQAVSIARELLHSASANAEIKTASILSTGYGDDEFDCVISRDVIDHISKKDAMIAIHELYRITNPGGIVIFTLDPLDEEYEKEPHIVNDDGDYVFTSGKWDGMIFHPYSKQEILQMIPSGATCSIEIINGEMTVILTK